MAVDGLAPYLSTDPAVERFSEYRDTHQLEAFSVDADRIPSPYRANGVRSFEVRDNLLGKQFVCQEGIGIRCGRKRARFLGRASS